MSLSTDQVAEFNDEPRTMVELLSHWAKARPDSLAYTFLTDGETEEINVTFAQLDRKARAIAARLQSLGVRGARALLLYPPGPEYIAGLFGCFYAGVIAVPAYPPRPNRPMSRIQAIAANADASLALTTAQILSGAEKQFARHPELTALRWLVMEPEQENAREWCDPSIDGNTLAFLQYTSGSTSTPKGVMLTHANLLANQRMIMSAFSHTKETVFLGWLPLYHDMGLIGNVFQPLFLGVRCILMSPVHFLQRPARWLQGITRYRATTSGAPNFAYELCASQVTPEECATIDLSSWNLAFNGAEPIHPRGLERFIERFGPYGFRRESFYPCYGLAEASLLVTGGLRSEAPIYRTVEAAALEKDRVHLVEDKHPGTRTLVGCGRTWLEQEVLIVDPEAMTECPRGYVGEIWVRGPNVAHGYWRQPEETEQTFRAYLKDGRRGPFMRTGDLGFIEGGELFVTGRRKDLIIIAGRNHYPQDIERTVEASHPSLRIGCGAAFAIRIDEVERLVVAVEVMRHALRNLNGDEVITNIRQAITEEHEVKVDAVVLLKTSTIPKTSSGKIQRHACKAQFLNGELQEVGRWGFDPGEATKEAARAPESSKNEKGQPRGVETEQLGEVAIRSWLIDAIAKSLKVDDVDVTKPFASFGMDSITAIRVTERLGAWLGRTLSPTLTYDYPTIKALARHLSGEPAAGVPVVAAVRPERSFAREPIAIIGIGCRFPGASDPDAFWRLLCSGTDAVGEVPAERWDLKKFYDTDASTPGKMNTRWGGFIENVQQFDPHFFGISPREASRMDPQQRLLLEVAWEALEDGGQVAQDLAGTATGVFIGISTHDYSRIQFSNAAFIDAYAGTGNAFSIAANRLSYLFDFQGPSLAVDTACSSSLVAVHLACQSLWANESTLALAGGANVILSPMIAINFTKSGAMAPDGRCKAFDARANGYVRGEGVGIVVLKPLSQALADHDPIYAVIRGSAVNQDGRTNGLMAPNQYSQEKVLRQAYKSAGVEPAQVQYVEAHGTGTFLGDPIEAKALGAVVATNRPSGNNCVVGSVKTNIGHLEAAAGVAGLIKVALSLKHRAIPPSLHFEQPNPHIPFNSLALRVCQTLEPWPTTTRPALAGVSSLGFGGTNSHIVLEEAPQTVEAAASQKEKTEAVLLPLSARNPQALESLVEAYRNFLTVDDAASRPSLRDICYTAGIRRTHHDYRLAMVARTREEFGENLGAYLVGESRPGMTAGRKLSNATPKLAFVFPGQGSQWFGMGRQLLARESVFREALENCDLAMQPFVDWSLLEQLTCGEERSRFEEIAVVQPLIFAIQVALAKLWRSWGVEPAAVVGQSMGEVAAAHVAGGLNLEDAARVICRRSQLLKRTSRQGSMASVELSMEAAQKALRGYEDRLSIAVSNGPTSTVLSGDPEALKKILATLERQNIFCRQVKVDVASHSPQMDPLQADLLRILAGITSRPATLPLYSTVTGTLHNGNGYDETYWWKNLRQTVLFATAVQRMVEDGYNGFLEISPHPVLLPAIQQVLKHAGTDGAVLPSLRRGEDEQAALLGAAGGLFAHGYPVDWNRLNSSQGRCVSLPSYPWQRERCWLDIETTDGSAETAARLLDQTGKPTAEPQNGPPRELQEWLYQFRWEPQILELKSAQPDRPSTPGPWLIFSDSQGFGAELARQLRAKGETCVLVYQDTSYETMNGAQYRIRADHKEDFERLLAEAFDPSQPACHGVVYLWSLDAPEEETLSPAAVEHAQVSECLPALKLIQSLAQGDWQKPPRLWLVTRDAQPVYEDDRTLSFVQSSLWGLSRVITLEHPELRCVRVDLAADSRAADIGVLLRELNEDGQEDQVAFRGSSRYVLRLARYASNAGQTISQSPASRVDSPLAIRPEGTYLITGGLGALGLTVARWLIKRGARYLALLGRKGADKQTEKLLAELRAKGARILVIKADVARYEELSAALKLIDRSLPELRGLVHAAGILDDATLLQLDRERLARVMQAKCGGAWNLHQLTLHRPLDFFVSFSSAAALIGSPGQGNYAAANAALDAIMHSRHAKGLPALTINWGPWSEIGLAARPDRGGRLTFHGIGSINPKQGIEALEHLLQDSAVQVGVIPIDWAQLRALYPAFARSVLFTHLMSEEPGTEAEKKSTVENTISREDLLVADPAQRRGALEIYLRNQAGRVLGLAASRVDIEAPLISLGIDSIMAIELKNRVETALGVIVPIVSLLKGPSLSQLATQILEQISEGSPSDQMQWSTEIVVEADDASPGAEQENAEQLLANLDELSNEEVDSLLGNMLADASLAETRSEDWEVLEI